MVATLVRPWFGPTVIANRTITPLCAGETVEVTVWVVPISETLLVGVSEIDCGWELAIQLMAAKARGSTLSITPSSSRSIQAAMESAPATLPR